jgi:regulator of protease activity HflC (stomatin/prohibitin superfamily)
MKQFFKLLAAGLLLLTFSCTTVESGHKGVKIGWGGETDMTKVYDEGMDTGISWIWNDMVEYDVREHTMIREFEFNDANDMLTKVKVALDYNLSPEQVNKLHKGINSVEIKIETSLSSAAKEVVPQYGAVELNKHKRAEGERLLAEILKIELQRFFVDFQDVRFTDIGIPTGISRLAEQTAVQIGKNELAEKMELEKKNLAKAKVAEAQGNYDAAQLDVKTKELMSRPAVLNLYKAETDRKWAEKGVSPYGNNNVFGAETTVLKGFK